MNYCNLRRDLSNVPFLSNTIKHVANYGNFAKPCPWKPGLYSLKNMPMDENFVPMPNLIQKGKILVINHYFDENKQVELIFKFALTLNIN
jgi:hypothetical protein